MERHCVFIATFVLTYYLVQAQDQTGFISVDCGLPHSERPYDAIPTGLKYTSDENLVTSGEKGRIAKEFEPRYTKPVYTMRYFPHGVRNCYNLNVTRDTNYLIRGTFVYGNYDGIRAEPNFDVHLGPNLWTTVNNNDSVIEIIHVVKSDFLQVCLVKTGLSIPFINVLELRPMNKTMYATQTGSLSFLYRRRFSNSSPVLRYPNDVYDRKWYPTFFESSWKQVTTILNVDNDANGYKVPEDVMETGVTPLNASEALSYSWMLNTYTTQFYIYMHFAEVETLRTNDIREFYITMNGKLIYNKPYSPRLLESKTLSSQGAFTCDKGECLLQLVKTQKSTLPPLLNAIEIFTVIEFPQIETNEIDVYGIKNVQDIYELSRISWQGDPCVPKMFMWDGLTCDDSDIYTPPMITSLDLSSSGLSGTITEAIKNLTHIEKLDLSNNSLTGEIPEFLADIKSLLVINLSGNNFTGSVPHSLLGKKGIKLNVGNNPHLVCTNGSCESKGENEHKKKSVIVPVVASIASLAILIGAFATFLVLKKKKTSKVEGIYKLNSTIIISKHIHSLTISFFVTILGQQTSLMQASDDKTSQQTIMTKNKRFTYSEVLKMTNNFERVLGKGGFGIVYHGFANGSEQVAIKMLSHSSSQGYKEFKAEVELLLRVHHKNLVGLVGYCDEGENLALIYEYMANGDLKEHMSGSRNRLVLNWGTRLKIVVESAQGLEYLHNGCKPPMVHRDVKTTNILLTKYFEAKLADFGLSRSFPIEGETHVSTVIAGTPGYLDPEYYRTNWLTEKSDVYSFGIVLLEIITNRHVIDQSREKKHIAEWVGLMLTKGDIVSIMDPSLNGDYDLGSVWKVVELAMSCVNPSSTRRPTMSQVVNELKECLASENARGGANRDMDSKSSIEVSMTIDTDVSPAPR
ncbi:unnamed protein product [Cochlearia groenlandica]